MSGCGGRLRWKVRVKIKLGANRRSLQGFASGPWLESGGFHHRVRRVAAEDTSEPKPGLKVRPTILSRPVRDSENFANLFPRTGSQNRRNSSWATVNRPCRDSRKQLGHRLHSGLVGRARFRSAFAQGRQKAGARADGEVNSPLQAWRDELAAARKRGAAGVERGLLAFWSPLALWRDKFQTYGINILADGLTVDDAGF